MFDLAAASLFLAISVQGSADMTQGDWWLTIPSTQLQFAGSRARMIGGWSKSELSTEEIAKALNADDPRVRRLVVDVLADRNDIAGAEALLQALSTEEDPAVSSRIAVVLGRHSGDAPGAVKRLLKIGETRLSDGGATKIESRESRLYDTYLWSRILKEMEVVLVDRSIPGFYDGQFDTLVSIDPEIFPWLGNVARNSEVNFAVRVLSIMALHRMRSPKIIDELVPLIMRPEAEVDFDYRIERNPSEFLIEAQRRANLSAYARYSMAKAGFSRYIDEKIDVMSRLVASRQMELDVCKGGQEIPWQLDFTYLRMMFEIGYHHQQIDDYDRASAAYLKLVDGWPNASSASNAHYNLACIYSIRNEVEKSVDHLEKSVENGFADIRWISEDGDLKNIRNHPRFQKIIGVDVPLIQGGDPNLGKAPGG